MVTKKEGSNTENKQAEEWRITLIMMGGKMFLLKG